MPPASQAVAVATAAAPAVTAKPIVVLHKHTSPGIGIGMIVLGLVLWLTFEVLVEFPVYLGMDPVTPIPQDVGFLLRFSGFLFIAVGAITGLATAKGRE